MYVLKAQVQAGGRKLGHFCSGGGSGIQFTRDPQEVPIIVSKMLGNRLVTKQTTAEGVVVNTVRLCFIFLKYDLLLKCFYTGDDS